MKKLLIVLATLALVACASEVKHSPQPPKPSGTKVEPKKEEAPKAVEKPAGPKEEKPAAPKKKKSKKKSKKKKKKSKKS